MLEKKIHQSITPVSSQCDRPFFSGGAMDDVLHHIGEGLPGW